MRKSISSLAVVGVLLATPLFAGDYAKCDAKLDACLAKMAEHLKSRGWVGIEYDNDQASGRMKIERVIADSPAYKADLRKGDELQSINGVSFASTDKEALKAATKEWSPGTTVTYTVLRDAKEMKVMVTLGETPKDVLAQWVGNHMLEHHVPEQMAKK